MRVIFLILATLLFVSTDANAGFGKRSYRGFHSPSKFHSLSVKKKTPKKVVIGRYDAKKVNGRRVYQQKIDWDKKDKNGLTNRQRAQNGSAPLGKDGRSMNLHHVTQDEPGSLAEVSESTHQKYKRQLHGAPPNGSSFRNDTEKEKQFNNYRSNYWKERAKDAK